MTEIERRIYEAVEDPDVAVEIIRMIEEEIDAAFTRGQHSMHEY